MTVLLVLATIADLGLAALLIGVSGFIFGGGPESMHGPTVLAAAWIAMIVGCFAAPAIGFVLRARGRRDLGALIAWLPPVAGVAALAFPHPY
jgi:hypothetical protein